MPEFYTSGIAVQEIPQHEQFIASASTSVTAFIGRTQRGPVNEPVRVESFDEFQRTFGGLWGLSTLSVAVDQFFSQGGQAAVIVRVINGGRGVGLSLPAGDQFLELRARDPGTHEAIRASVDHDGIEAGDSLRFNLVLQRLTQYGSERVLEQESYRKVSVSDEDERYIGELLGDSRLVTLEAAVPGVRPDRTPPARPDLNVGYQQARRDGHDGEPLTDYDIIGSATGHSGLFALSRSGGFNLLCIPPLDRERDVGLVSWLAAVRYCKAERAILVMDPPREWQTVDQAVAGVKQMNFASEDAVIAFPRLTALGGTRDSRSFAPCGVLAGLLARNDARYGVWSTPSRERANLNARIRPELVLEERDLIRLASAGINGITGGRPGQPAGLASARTMAAGDSSAPSWNYLAARRLSLMILDSVEKGTRWAVFTTDEDQVWRRVREQVSRFLHQLWEKGALLGENASEAYFVQCDADTNLGQEELGEVKFVIGFALRRPMEFLSFEIRQRREGALVRRSNVQPFALYGR